MKKKYCPKCDRNLSVKRFGVCKSRKDKLNAYCRICIVATVKAFRQRRREMKAAIKERQRMEDLRRKPSVTSPYVSIAALAKVRNAVKDGCVTRDAIQAQTKLNWDQLCEALAELTFQRGVLRIVREGSTRKFQITERAA